MSLSCAGKKSFGKVVNSKNPRTGKEIEINSARLGTAKDQVKKLLYLSRIFLL
jgi:hypothetical protein